MELGKALSTAAQHHQAGRLEAAEALYMRVLAAVPDQFDALHLLGVSANQRGDPRRAVELISRAIGVNGASADSHNNLASAYASLGQLPEAVSSYRSALALDANLAAAHEGLAQALRRLNQAEEALPHARRAFELTPTAHALEVLGAVLYKRGDLEEAISAFRRELELEPLSAAAHNSLANALQLTSDLADAERHYRKAVELNPHFAAAWANLGALLTMQRRLPEAVTVLGRALQLAPDSPSALNALGVARREMGRPDEAAELFERTLGLDAGYAEAWNNLSIARLDQGRVPDAVDCCRKALQVAPDFVKAHNSLLFALIFLGDGPALAEEQQRWAARHAADLANLAGAHGNDCSPDRRLRVGYVSPNFREHCQALFLVPLLSSHDKKRVEVYCYSDVTQPDAVTGRLRSCADVWRDVCHLSDEQLAAQIRTDRIDVLVDLTMHLAGNRALVFARKPAPVQVCWLAYPGSTGMEAMDYRISDPHLDPIDEAQGGSIDGAQGGPPGLNDHLYTEETIRLPDAFWCYDPLEQQTAVSEPPSVRNGYITFASLNNYCKVNPEVLKLWARVLREVPASRMIVLSAEGAHRQHGLALLASEGIDPRRISFVKHRPREQYLLYCHEIDIVLDTFPSNGHTTSLDMFWMGVPVVTMVGATVTGRAGLCQATLLGLNELVARDGDQYVRIAAELSRDRQRLAGLRRSLRGRLKESPLMDGPRFARNMEAAYRTMWQRWCDGRGRQDGALAGRQDTELPVEFAEVGPPDEVPARVVNPAIEPRRWESQSHAPRVTCVMVTGGRAALAQQAIACYRDQAYPNKELLIVSDREESELAQHIASLGDPDIRLVHMPSNNKTLGERRNDAIANAQSDWVCIWDDDDLYDPARLSAQVSAVRRFGASASVLERVMLWWPGRQRLAISARRAWEGSLLALKSEMPRYAPLARAEDTPVLQRLLASVRVVSVDLPRLYVYVAHDANTSPEAQFEHWWRTATDRFVSRGYHAALQELSLSAWAEQFGGFGLQ